MISLSESEGSGADEVGRLRARRARPSERPRSVRISWLCWPSVGAGVRSQRSTLGEAERQRRVRLHADHRVVGLLVVAAGDELRVLRGAAGVERRAPRAPPRRRAGRPPCRDRRRRPTRPSFSSSRSCAARRPAWVRSAGSVAQSGRPSASTIAAHCSSVGDRDHQPPLRACRSRTRPAARPTGCGCPRATSALPYARPLDDQLGRDVQRGLEHRSTRPSSRRRCDRAPRAPTSAPTTACMPPLGSHGPRWMRGWSSTWPVSHASPVTCSIVCAKPGPVAPRAVEPERGHAHHHRARVGRVDDVPAEVELLDHPGRVVLDDEVALLDHAQRELAPFGSREVEGEVALVGVRGVEERAVAPTSCRGRC